jgi:Ser/Thr protein kinase RdoA (MazF antagonist)
MTSPGPATASQSTPFAGLTPDFVLDALDSVGLHGDGRLLQLNSYENRVFQVFLQDGTAVVAKFYRPGRWSNEQILEEHGFALELAAEEIPVVAPLTLAVAPTSRWDVRLFGEPATLAEVRVDGQAHRFAVAPRCAGAAPSLESSSQLEWIGRFIGRIHMIGSLRSFQFRQTLSVQQFGWVARDWVWERGIVPPDAAHAWKAATEQALKLADASFDRAGFVPNIRLHGDCHVGNLLWNQTGPHFVDLDDAVTGPAVQDLWMLLPEKPSAADPHVKALLTGYETFMEFDDRELGLVESLRTLRMIHHSAWLAKRWADPAFPPAFPWFGAPAYWQQQTRMLQEQCEAMLSSPSI